MEGRRDTKNILHTQGFNSCGAHRNPPYFYLNFLNMRLNVKDPSCSSHPCLRCEAVYNCAQTQNFIISILNVSTGCRFLYL